MQNLIPLANPLENITRIEYHGQRVLTTAQLAEFYECSTSAISNNFKNNEDRYVKGKHYFKVEGDELKVLRSENFGLQISPQTRVVYLWTKRGAARHCKSVGTDKAWEVFEVLEDTYFSEPVNHEKPLPSVTDFQRAVAFTKLAAHADDPYMKKRLVIEAANLLFGEEVFKVQDWTPHVQMTLFR